MNREQFQALLAYIGCISICSYYFFYFINTNRCFIKEPGERYPKGMGVEEYDPVSTHIMCHIDWMFLTPTFLLLPLVMVGLTVWLKRNTAGAMKVIIMFIVFAVLSLGYLEMITVKDQWRKTMRTDGY